MRTSIKLLVTCVAMISGALMLGAPVIAQDIDSELQSVRQKVTERFDAIEADDIDRSEIDGWYKIQKGSIVAYVSADGRYLLQGDVIDLERDVNLTEASRSNARRELLAATGDDEAIVFSPASPTYSVTIFTDIDCSYCRRLHEQIDEYMALGIEVRYFLYPRMGPSSRAWITSEEVWCSQNRQHALTMAKLDRKFDSESCDASAVSQHYVIGQQVGLSGTPAIVLEDGELIGGYLAPEQLKTRLDSKFGGE